VQRQRGKRLLEHLVVLRRVLIPVLSLVKVIVYVKLTKVRSRHERVTPPHEVRTDFKALWL
jgi:hypothetical protein